MKAEKQMCSPCGKGFLELQMMSEGQEDGEKPPPKDGEKPPPKDGHSDHKHRALTQSRVVSKVLPTGHTVELRLPSVELPRDLFIAGRRLQMDGPPPKEFCDAAKDFFDKGSKCTPADFDAMEFESCEMPRGYGSGSGSGSGMGWQGRQGWEASRWPPRYGRYHGLHGRPSRYSRHFRLYGGT